MKIGPFFLFLLSFGDGFFTTFKFYFIYIILFYFFLYIFVLKDFIDGIHSLCLLSLDMRYGFVLFNIEFFADFLCS
jgi:hypothetical protein